MQAPRTTDPLADARRLARRIHRDNPAARLIVAGCSAALRPADYRRLEGVGAVVAGSDPGGSKYNKAIELRVPLLDQSGLLQLIGEQTPAPEPSVPPSADSGQVTMEI